MVSWPEGPEMARCLIMHELEKGRSVFLFLLEDSSFEPTQK